MTSTALVDRRKKTSLRRLSNVIRPSSMAAVMLTKLSSVRTMSSRLAGDIGPPAAHGDADVRRFQSWCVIDPISRDGDDLASLLQRPHDAQLLLRRHRVNRGRTHYLAQAVVIKFGELRTGQDHGAIVSDGQLTPIACAVAAWSPVIITARTPAAWQDAIASRTPARGGSTIPCRPRNVSPPGSTTVSGPRGGCDKVDRPWRAPAIPGQRDRASRLGSVRQRGGQSCSPSIVSHIARTRSGAPLTKICCSSSRWRTLAEYWRAGSKGISANTGEASRASPVRCRGAPPRSARRPRWDRPGSNPASVSATVASLVSTPARRVK